jgi:hypothetical protein
MNPMNAFQQQRPMNPPPSFGFFPPQRPLIRPRPHIQVNATKITNTQVPVTCVFVGNISDKCGNDLIQAILTECGVISNWKRIQGSNGKFQAFGFCDFEHPEGTMRALRILDGFCIGGKRLTVKAEEKTIKMIQDFVHGQREYKCLPRLQLKEGELPQDEEIIKEDDHIRDNVRKLVAEVDPDLLVEPAEEPKLEVKSPVKKEASPSSEEGEKKLKVIMASLSINLSVGNAFSFFVCPTFGHFSKFSRREILQRA